CIIHSGSPIGQRKGGAGRTGERSECRLCRPCRANRTTKASGGPPAPAGSPTTHGVCVYLIVGSILLRINERLPIACDGWLCPSLAQRSEASGQHTEPSCGPCH